MQAPRILSEVGFCLWLWWPVLQVASPALVSGHARFRQPAHPFKHGLSRRTSYVELSTSQAICPATACMISIGPFQSPLASGEALFHVHLGDWLRHCARNGDGGRTICNLRIPMRDSRPFGQDRFCHLVSSRLETSALHYAVTTLNTRWFKDGFKPCANLLPVTECSGFESPSANQRQSRATKSQNIVRVDSHGKHTTHEIP